MNWWDSSVFWGIMGVIGGGVITYFSQKFPITKQKILYKKETSCLISKETTQINGLKIEYNDNKLYNLYLSKITISNKGYAKILENDFVSNHPISFSSNGQIFTKTLDIGDLSNSNDICIIPDSTTNAINRIIVDIKLLPPHNSFSFSFIHTDNITFDGVLKEGNIIEYKKHNYKKTIFQSLLILNFIVAFINMGLYHEESNKTSEFIFITSFILFFLYQMFWGDVFDKK